MRRIIPFVTVAVVLLALLASCSLFVNRAPIARIAASALSGASPLSVWLDATGSYDPDGRIVAYAWSFGDGEAATGAILRHVYAPRAAATYTATLTVTDDEGAMSAASQTIEVHAPAAPENNPPSPRFTFEPTHGDAPLAVTFDATLTRDVDGEVEVYAWDFGDGTTGSGPVIAHTFDALASTNYGVTMTATDDDGGAASTTAIVSVYVPEDVPFDGPTAEFIIGEPLLVYDSPALPDVPSLFEVVLDPEGSAAAPGHGIVLYVWTFGDGESASVADDEPVTHVYQSGAPTHTFVIGLTVIDEQGLRDSAVRSVTVVND